MANPCQTTPTTGLQLLRETTPGAGIFEAIGGIITFPDYNAEEGTDQCGDFDTTVDGYQNLYKNGQKTQAAMAFGLNFRSMDGAQKKFKEDFDSSESRLYRVQLPDPNSTRLDLNMLATTWGLTFPSGGGNIGRNVTLQPTGTPVAYTE